MEKVNVTYTREQLRAFTLAELKTLDLHKRTKISKKVTTKGDTIKLMLAKQKEEQKKIKDAEKKAKAKAEKEAKAKAKKEADKKAKADAKDKKEAEEKAKEEKSKDPVFHRPVRKRNAHMH